MTFTEKADRLAARLGNNVDYLNKIKTESLTEVEKEALFKLKNHATIYSDTLEELIIHASTLVKKGEHGTVVSLLKSIEEYNDLIENLNI